MSSHIRFLHLLNSAEDCSIGRLSVNLEYFLKNFRLELDLRIFSKDIPEAQADERIFNALKFYDIEV